ncbi:MAG TPA: prealbumin-like fold domain-containing protein [Levilactobacillus hammesii]|uniref:Prealbumin-like fold domain-containing protein n=1 Tax=Levilactobacillus hammesii TaxID=267633 RepID=A0A921EZH3_9LACO|nr:prealbumin-like fold domain-containing protein [Levilactobacillus hammesii]
MRPIAWLRELRAVQDDTAVVKDNLVTDNKGQVTVSKLAPGTYYFEETHAPSGYQPNSEPVKVTITNEDTSVQTVSQSDQPTENSSSSNNSSSGSETPSSSSSSDASSSAPTADNSKTPSSSTTDDTQSGTEPDTSSTKTTSSSSTSTKTQHQVVANVGTSSSSSTLPYRHGAAAADNGASQSQRSSKPATGVQRLLPKTNGQRSLIAMLIGFLILGLSVAGWRWHESRSTR